MNQRQNRCLNQIKDLYNRQPWFRCKIRQNQIQLETILAEVRNQKKVNAFKICQQLLKYNCKITQKLEQSTQ